MMTKADSLLQKAEKGGFWLWMVNRVLWRVIPFNGVHKPLIKNIQPNLIKTSLLLTRRNKNHLGGMHACALATLAEYSCGILMLKNFGSKYRLIMKSIHVDYHVQCRTDALCKFELQADRITEIREALLRNNKTELTCEVQILDLIGQTTCTAKVEWQLKEMAW